MSLLISCETSGEQIPPQFTDRNQTDPLNLGRSHATRTGVDRAARYVANRMARRLQAELVTNDFAPWLIDVTRSLHHRQLFPAATRDWSKVDRQSLIHGVHQPYRDRIRRAIRLALSRSGNLVHLSIRTFPLRHGGKMRRADMGLAYDPARDAEVDFCLDWIDEMWDPLPMLRVRRNYPRRGTTDSLTKAMRSEFENQNYLGIEVLLNRSWAGRNVAIRDQVIDAISDAFARVATSRPARAA